MARQIQEQDIVWVHQGNKDRKGVVMEVHDDELCVSVMGYTSQLHEQFPYHMIDPGTRLGARNARSMGITVPTYFYKRNMKKFRVEDIRSAGNLRCHHVVFNKLREIALGPDENPPSE